MKRIFDPRTGFERVTFEPSECAKMWEYSTNPQLEIGMDPMTDEVAAAIEYGVPDEIKSTLYALSMRCITRAQHNRETAIKIFIEEITNNSELLNVLVERAARYFIRIGEHGVRKKLQTGQSNGEDDVGEFRAIKRMAKDWLDEWILATGHALGDANAETLAQNIADYDAKIEGFQQRRKFLFKISERLKRGKFVRQCLSNEDIALIWESVS